MTENKAVKEEFNDISKKLNPVNASVSCNPVNYKKFISCKLYKNQ